MPKSTKYSLLLLIWGSLALILGYRTCSSLPFLLQLKTKHLQLHYTSTVYPNNNDNQDIISMGTNAAVSCQKIINNTFEILAIELIAITQAIDALDLQDKISASTKNLYDDIRKILPVVTKDIAPILL